MFLKYQQDGALVEVQDIKMLVDPNESKISGRIQSGQEEQDLTDYEKVDLIFLSGEDLPRCWVDEHYRDL